MSTQPDLGNLTVSSRDLARLLATSVASISRYVAEGMPKTQAGRYPLVEAVAWHTRRLRQRQPSSTTNLRDQLLAAKIERAKIENDQLAGTLIELEYVGTVMNQMVGGVATELDALAARATPQILRAGLDGTAIQRILFDECRLIRANAGAFLQRLAEDVRPPPPDGEADAPEPADAEPTEPAPAARPKRKARAKRA